MKNDEIYPITRIVAAIVVPFLWLAFLILYFFPDLTGERFAWAIKPNITSMYIGAGYLGGSWLFLNAIFGKRWHRIQGGFAPVTTFTWFMLIDTFLHWDRFSHGKLGFTLWLILYIVTPFLVPVIWFNNKKTDSGQPEESDLMVSPIMRWLLRIIGVFALVFVAAGFLSPQLFIRVWPWTLTPLTARIMAGWIALLSVGSLTMSADLRWSSWRVPMESIFIWHVLVIVAAIMKVSDFTMGIINWYLISITMMVVAIFVFYLMMENQRRKNLDK